MYMSGFGSTWDRVLPLLSREHSQPEWCPVPTTVPKPSHKRCKSNLRHRRQQLEAALAPQGMQGFPKRTDRNPRVGIQMLASGVPNCADLLLRSS